MWKKQCVSTRGNGFIYIAFHQSDLFQSFRDDARGTEVDIKVPDSCFNCLDRFHLRLEHQIIYFCLHG